MSKSKKTGDILVGYDPKTVYKKKSQRRKLHLKEKYRGVHMEVLGASGTGKTYLLEHMIRQDILAGRGVCVIDPGGDLYSRLVNFCHINRFKSKIKERLILIDPRDEEWAIGLNYLAYREFNARASLTAHGSLVMRGIAKVFGDENLDQTPRLSKWMYALILVLSESGLTLAEAQEFITNPDARQWILNKVNNPYVIEQWQRFGDYDLRQQIDYTDSTENRITRFIFSDRLRRIVGQDKSRINFREAIDNEKIILVNLAPDDQLSSDEAHFVGVMLIDKISQAARSRTDIPERKRKRMYFFIDEFHNYLCDDIVKGMKELRKFGLSFVLATQDILPLREKYVELYSAVQDNTTIKFAFALQPEDADLMIRYLFPEYLADDQVKRIIERTYYRPELGRQTIYGESHSRGSSWGSGSGSSDLSGWATAMNLDSGGGELNIIQSTSHILGSNYSETSSDSIMDSKSKLDIPFYYLEEEHEIASIEDYTPEEKKQKVVSQLVNQKDRHGYVKVRGLEGDAWAIYTPDLPLRVKILRHEFIKFERLAKSRAALPSVEADRLIQERRHLLLGGFDDEKEIITPDIFGE